jgi:hypothetical protein
MTDRKKPGVAFWATVVVLAALMYPLSFGPMNWLIGHRRGLLPESAIPALVTVYSPMIWAYGDAPPAISVPVRWYTDLW